MTTPRIEDMADSVMGLIIQNSVGLTCSDKPNDYGYANGVYLNNIKAELPSILTQARQAGIDEAVEDKRKLLEDFADFARTHYLGTDGEEYAYSQQVIYMVEDYLAIKALQDNK